jgi:hypothetical protein
LGLKYFIRLSFFSLCKRLADAENSVEAVFLSTSYFGGDNLVGFSEEGSPFRVSNDYPVKAKVLDLFSTYFASESSIFIG